jgi:hypothetical protein
MLRGLLPDPGVITLLLLDETEKNMAMYRIPQMAAPLTVGPNEAYLVASGDLRLSANQTC